MPPTNKSKIEDGSGMTTVSAKAPWLPLSLKPLVHDPVNGVSPG